MGELQRAEALALATPAMPEDEYAFITEEVYKSMWTDFGSSKSEGNPARQVSKAVQSASDALKNVDGKGLPKEAADALENASAGLSQGASEVSESLERVRTPAENVALFKKYEADLKKYAMPGLGALFGDEQKDRGPRNKPS